MTTSRGWRVLALVLLLTGAGIIILAPLPWTFAGFLILAAGIPPAVEQAKTDRTD